MEFILFISLLLHLLGQSESQNHSDIPPDIEVTRISWAKYRGSWSDLRRSERPNPGDQKREYRREMENRNSIENRSRDMLELEESVRREAREAKPVDMFKYRIELKNRGSRVIKWIFLDYQTAVSSDPDNPSHRQFACVVKVKPEETEKIDAYSLLPPTRLISATDAQAGLSEKLVINRVEYHDGTIWQRPGWPAPESLPSRSTGRGPCRAI